MVSSEPMNLRPFPRKPARHASYDAKRPCACAQAAGSIGYYTTFTWADSAGSGHV